MSELRTESYLLLIKADTDAARPSSYRWGPRARAEFSFPDLVHFICEIMDLYVLKCLHLVCRPLVCRWLNLTALLCYF